MKTAQQILINALLSNAEVHGPQWSNCPDFKDPLTFADVDI